LQQRCSFTLARAGVSAHRASVFESAIARSNFKDPMIMMQELESRQQVRDLENASLGSGFEHGRFFAYSESCKPHTNSDNASTSLLSSRCRDYSIITSILRDGLPQAVHQPKAPKNSKHSTKEIAWIIAASNRPELLKDN
jgi:hypothetical protein